MPDAARQVEQLRSILAVARQMAVTTDLDTLLRTIVEAACSVLACERATIFLYDAATNELYSRVATGAEAIRFPADRGIAGAAAQQRCVINVPDAYADDRFNREIDKKTGFQTRNLLTFPLESLDGKLTGVLQALNRTGGPFAAEDEQLALALAAQAGVALHRHALLDEFAAKQRMQRDLDIARRIQQGLFPKSDPQVAGYDVAGWNRPADETGGDCYDFIPLSDGRLVLLMADATGHGIGAALVMANCRSLLRAMLSVTDHLPTIVERVNRLLAADLGDERFVTAFLGILMPQQHRIDYFSCGQGPLLLVHPATTNATGRESSGTEERFATNLPLAIDMDQSYDEPAHFDFGPGSTLVLLTDGFFEAQNATGDQLGEQRVVDFVRANGRMPLQQLILGLHESVRTFSGRESQLDDLTAVLVRRST